MTDVPHRFAIDAARRQWSDLTLAGQFLLAGGAVLVAGMLVIGVWVTRQIEAGVTRNSAAATALYVDSLIAPLLPDIQDGETLSQGARRALDETLSRGALGQRLASFKIWKPGGLISYSSRSELIGTRFPESDSLQRAWAGQVTAEFDDLDEDENSMERAEGVPLLEVYSPIRQPWSGEVIAVAEFYEVATDLRDNLVATRLRSWIVVAGVTLGMMGLLFGIVLRGSRVIKAQQHALQGQVADLSHLLKLNQELRWRVQGASSRAVALNEQYLKRISADLHDGPAQLLALASLRMGNQGAGSGSPALSSGELHAIRGYLDDAMREIRDICRGLTLPQIEPLGLPDLMRAAVGAHEQRTGTSVELEAPDSAPPLTQSEKICAFRFVQEGLSNAFRHAGGVGQKVSGVIADGHLTISVADAGQGFDVGTISGDSLGLAGLRERVQSLGGAFEVASSPSGTHLTMKLRLTERETR